MADGAFGGGVEPGGLRDKNDVKILICYLLGSIRQPLSRDALAEALGHDGLVNYFTLADALSELLVTGHVDLIKENGEECYKTTHLGTGTADLFERRLPYSVREKAVAAALRLIAREKRARENRVEIVSADAGFVVRCAVLDRKDELLSIALLVPDRAQAEAVKRHFLNDPLAVYRSTVALMTGDPDTVGGVRPPEKPPSA